MVDSDGDAEQEFVEDSTASRAKCAEEDDLGGAIPPSDIDDATATRVKAEVNDEEYPPRGGIPLALSRWGLWRRLTRYMETRRDEVQSIWQEHDDETNLIGCLPDDENVQVPAIWVAELYTPSNVAKLLRSISDLGWEHGRTRDDSLLKWMSEVRQGRRAGWTNLGPVSPPSETRFIRERTAVLPEGVRVAMPVLMSLTPSITALVTAFLLDDKTADSLEEPLRAKYTTYTERSRLFSRRDLVRYILFGTPARLDRSIHDPDLQRRESAKACLAQLEGACFHWIRDNLPGVFASGIYPDTFPSAILLVTETTSPATSKARSIRAFEGLSINRDYDAWESAEWPSARLVLPRAWGDEGLRLTFACRRRDAFPDRPGYPDPESNSTIAQRANDQIRGLLSRWALSGMLNGYHEQLSELRDRVAESKTYRPVQDLKRLRSLVRTKLFDIITSSHEIEEFTQAEREYRRDVLELKYIRSSAPEPKSLIDAVSNKQRRDSVGVRRNAELLQSILSVTVDASQTIGGIRIQRLAILLSVISVGIAIIAVILSSRIP